jgi:hypothetical protein
MYELLYIGAHEYYPWALRKGDREIHLRNFTTPAIRILEALDDYSIYYGKDHSRWAEGEALVSANDLSDLIAQAKTLQLLDAIPTNP